MTEGSNQGLFVIISIVIFGIFVSMVYLLFGDNLKPTLSSIFTDSVENVYDDMGIDFSVYLSSLSYDDWVEYLKRKGYVVATDSDFSVDSYGYFRYIGTAKKIIIPKIIKGVPITKTTYMFANSTPIEAVAIKNPNVTDMSHMFASNQSTSLDLSNLFTENVTNMSYMFMNSKATSLKLTNFNTSKVKSMAGMFEYIKATNLDLSSFDTSSIGNIRYDMSNMFYGANQAKIGYARTLADATKFNKASDKPSTLNFVVK